MEEKKPDESIGRLSGLYYKIGRFGFAYYWNNGEWIKSDQSAGVITDRINKKKGRFSLD